MNFNPLTLFGLLDKENPEQTKQAFRNHSGDRRNNSYNRGAGHNSFESFPSVANSRRTPTGRQFSELDRLRARLRWLYENDPFVNSIVENIVVNVVGDALPKLFLDNPKLAEEMRKNIGDQYRKWAKDPKMVDYMRRHNFYMMLCIIVRHFVIEGEAFIRLHNKGTADFRMEIVDPGLVPVYTSEGFNRGSNLNSIYQLGAMVDQVGRITHWAVNSPIDNVGYRQHYTNFLSENTNLVPVDSMLHLYDPAEAGSYRGEPVLRTILTTASSLMEYNDSTIQNAKFGAMNIGMVKQGHVDEASVGGAVLQESNAIEAAEREPGDPLEETARSVVTADTGMTLHHVAEGHEFTHVDTKYPDGQFGAFTEVHQRNISAGAGVAYHAASGDLKGANFSSGRIGEQQMARRARRIQSLLDTQVISSIIPQLLTKFFMAGKIAPRAYSQCMTDDCHRMVYSGSFSLDPLKKVQAEAIEIANGTRSRREIIAEDGRDPDATIRNIEQETKAQPAKPSSNEEPKDKAPKDDPEPDEDDDSDEEDTNEDNDE